MSQNGTNSMLLNNLLFDNKILDLQSGIHNELLEEITNTIMKS